MQRATMKRTVLAAFAALALAGSAAAQEVTLKVSHFWPPAAMPPSKFLVPWCDKIATESNGRMKCQIFPAMQLGGTPPQLIDQASDGVADVVWTLPGYTAGRFPIMEVFELPFMTFNAESASKAAWDFYSKYAVKEFAGVKVLAINVHDQGYVHTRDRQIKTLADFKGIKMRAPSRQTNRMLAAFGATPVSMPVPGVTDAVSKGVIDGYLLPWEVIPSIKAHEVVKFHTETDPQLPRAVHRGVPVRDEPDEVRQPAAGPQDDHRPQQRRRDLGGARPAVGRVEAAGAQARGRPRQHVLHGASDRAVAVGARHARAVRRLDQRHEQARPRRQRHARRCARADHQVRGHSAGASAGQGRAGKEDRGEEVARGKEARRSATCSASSKA